MARRTGLAPYRQGHLDGLCGISALINAIRLATEADTRGFPGTVWQELFCTLLLEADEVVGTVNAVGLGIDTKPLYRVAQAAVRHMADEHGIRLTITHALRRGESHTSDAVLRRLTALTQQPRSAVLIRLAGSLDHWTILKAVTSQSLTFFDSSGHTRVSLTSCRANMRRQRGARRENVIERKGIFLVRAKPLG